MGTPRTRAGGQPGFSLVEALVALALCGMLLVGVIPGLFTTVTASTHNRDRSIAATRLTAVSDQFKVLESKPGVYKACAGPSQLEAAFNADPAGTLGGATLKVVSVQYWNGTSYVTGLATCPTKDRGIQLVTIKVLVGSGSAATSATGVVVVRNPKAAP